MRRRRDRAQGGPGAQEPPGHGAAGKAHVHHWANLDRDTFQDWADLFFKSFSTPFLPV